jgi:hypothetical protein
MRRLGCVLVLVAGALTGCAGLTVQQERGWAAFHDCRQGFASATLEDLTPSGMINYRTQEGIEFAVMKACMEARGYTCDLGLGMGSRPHTYCYPRTS